MHEEGDHGRRLTIAERLERVVDVMRRHSQRVTTHETRQRTNRIPDELAYSRANARRPDLLTHSHAAFAIDGIVRVARSRRSARLCGAEGIEPLTS
jgi:hypothetical protein